MVKNLKDVLNDVFRDRPNAYKLFLNLKKSEELYLFGGAVRDYLEMYLSGGSVYLPRDLDFVVQTKEKGFLERLLRLIPHKRNQFGGYKVSVDNIVFDIWELKNTWAFKKKIVREASTNLKKTVFLNIDAAVYDVHKDLYSNEGYLQAKANSEIDIVLKKNPCIELNLLRAIYFKQRYDLKLSVRLREMFFNKMLMDCHFLDKLFKSQENHYGVYKLALSDIKRELDDVKYSVTNNE